jgi:hypothetical protein
MKIVMIAALAAAQLAADPAQAAELPRRETAAQPAGTLTSMERTDLRDGQTPELLAVGAPESSRQAAQADEPRKKRKSTGDKVLTGAAVILGIGALAVGGLLVAIAVQ